jgi:hypothetical protein
MAVLARAKVNWMIGVLDSWIDGCAEELLGEELMVDS